MRGYRGGFWVIGPPPPPPRLSAIFFCLLICPGPCSNLDPLLKFLYETPPSECTKPPLLNPGSAPDHRPRNKSMVPRHHAVAKIVFSFLQEAPPTVYPRALVPGVTARCVWSSRDLWSGSITLQPSHMTLTVGCVFVPCGGISYHSSICSNSGVEHNRKWRSHFSFVLSLMVSILSLSAVPNTARRMK